MEEEYYKGRFKYSGNNFRNEKDIEDAELNSNNSSPGVFRFCGKCDFDNFDRFNLKEYNWKVDHYLTPKQKEFLKTFPGYKDNKETVNYSGPQGFAIMHRNYETDIHKLNIHPSRLEDSEDSIKAIKSMFELGLGTTCYDEDNLPEELAEKIRKTKESKLIKKIGSN